MADVMNAKDLLRYNMRLCRSVTEMYLADLSDAELAEPPAIGANSTKWQLGHLIVSADEMLRLLGGAPPALPKGFATLHAKDAPVPDVANLPAKSTYESLLKSQQEYALAFLADYPEAKLSEPGPEKMRGYLPTNASVLLMLGTHEMMHAGQIAVLRRRLGKPVVI